MKRSGVASLALAIPTQTAAAESWAVTDVDLWPTIAAIPPKSAPDAKRALARALRMPRGAAVKAKVLGQRADPIAQAGGQSGLAVLAQEDRGFDRGQVGRRFG